MIPRPMGWSLAAAAGSRGRMLAVAVAGLAVAPQSGGAPQQVEIPATPPDFRFDGNVGEWGDRPTLTLRPQGSGAPSGSVWLGAGEDGLAVAGRVTGVAPTWAREAARMAEGDHVEIWLADGDSLELPPVGWGNQFGETVLASIADCEPAPLSEKLNFPADSTLAAACRDWYAAQLRYRGLLARLFVRQWQLAPGTGVEAFAQPAFQALDQGARRQVAALEPAGPVELRAAGADTGYEFEVLVPWSAFPPVRSLELERLRVMVDVFRPGPGGRRSGPFSTTAAGRRWGDAGSFTAARLARPRRYSITPCRYPLAGFRASAAAYFGHSRVVPAEDLVPAYFVPQRSLEVSTTLGLENQSQGYAYSPAGHSPIVTPTAYFARRLPDGAWLCGPGLRTAAPGGTVRETDFTLVDSVAVMPLANRGILLRNGPRAFYSHFGSGQCGACPRVGLTILHVAATGAVESALEILEVSDESSEVDVALSQRWDTVRVYRSRPAPDSAQSPHLVWRETIHCLDPARIQYTVCAEHDSVPEPQPRRIVLPGTP